MENQQSRIFKVDELELVSLLREEGRGALEGEVDVNWDPDRYLIIDTGCSTILRKIIDAYFYNLDIDCYLIRFAMKENPELRLLIEKR